MVKIYKSAKGKLILYLPFDVTENLSLKEGDEVDFFKVNDNSFVFAKKSDITNLILNKPSPQQSRPAASPAAPKGSMPDEYIAILKKMDTLRYDNRTPENVAKLINDQEKRMLQKMIADKTVSLFKKNGKELYSISKDIYDKFLMRKKMPATPMPQKQYAPLPSKYVVPKSAPSPPAPGLDDEGVLSLEKNGFLVIQTEAEAGRISLYLEQSIRHGQILGTRAFNKKFYIVRRTYFDKYSGAILKKLRDKNYKVSDLATDLSIEEDGARAILYLLSENGDVSEKKRDTFAIA